MDNSARRAGGQVACRIVRRMRLTFALHDILAGASVACVLIRQSLAYAQLAGMPAYRALFAAAVPPLAAAFFASSPYLQPARVTESETRRSMTFRAGTRALGAECVPDH